MGELNTRQEGQTREKAGERLEIILETGQWTPFLSSLPPFHHRQWCCQSKLQQIFVFPRPPPCLHSLAHLPTFFLISFPYFSPTPFPIILSTSASPSWAVNIKDAPSWHAAYTCLPNCFLCAQLHAAWAAMLHQRAPTPRSNLTSTDTHIFYNYKWMFDLSFSLRHVRQILRNTHYKWSRWHFQNMTNHPNIFQLQIYKTESSTISSFLRASKCLAFFIWLSMCVYI